MNQLQRLGLVTSALLVLGVQSGLATDFRADKTGKRIAHTPSVSSVSPSVANISRIRDLNRPATTIKDWLAQIEAATVKVTGVSLNRTAAGLEIVLQTADNKPLQVDATKFRSEGNSLIADIPNAVLALPDAQAFNAENPTGEIASVRVTQVDASRIRVSVTGNKALPMEEVTLRTGELTYSLNPEADEPDEEIVVTGEGQRGYRVPNASTATKTDTPLRDIPQSIQVVPQQVIQDQQATRFSEALRNVSGTTRGAASPRFSFFEPSLIRGFTASFLRNGLQENTVFSPGFDAANTERIEVLKGPASVLYGQSSPGGTINIVTKQPSREPYYAIEGSVGSFEFYRGSLDLSGSLNDSRTVLYRLNVAAQTSESFADFFDSQRYLIAPVLTWQISDATKITLETEYFQITQPFDHGLPAVGSVLPNPNGKISRNLYVNEPTDNGQYEVFRVGYDLNHRFNDNWQIRNTFRYVSFGYDRIGVFSSSLLNDNRTLVRGLQRSTEEYLNYNSDTYVTGKFSTGNIQHQLTVGFNLQRQENEFVGFQGRAASLDVHNPVYGQPLGAITSRFNSFNRIDNLGFYLQDQIALTENLKLLVGGRFDIVSQEQSDRIDSSESFQQDEAFSPRVGIVYQPIPPISFYASYSRSFTPVLGNAFDGSQFQPERGTQYEIGVKAELNDRLAVTLAFYDLTRTNVSTADPINPSFSIQTGEQKSRGIEFDISGEILPGWNIIAGYAFTDTEITKDNTFAVGNRINNVPKHSFNLWMTYEIQFGSLKGFGVGAGLFYTGDRQGDLANTFEIPSYLRTDAAIFYKQGRFRAAINFKNLFNVDYFESAQSRTRVFLGDPFTVQGTISWQF